jgi:hypothetical protein
MKKKNWKKEEVKINLVNLEKNKIKKKECLYITAGSSCYCLGLSADYHGTALHKP